MKLTLEVDGDQYEQLQLALKSRLTILEGLMRRAPKSRRLAASLLIQKVSSVLIDVEAPRLTKAPQRGD